MINYVIDDQFKTQLMTSLLSCPIVYIPTYDYAYVTRAICEVVMPADRHHDLFGLCEKDILDYEASQIGEIQFMGNGGQDFSDFVEDLRSLYKGEVVDRIKKNRGEQLSERAADDTNDASENDANKRGYAKSVYVFRGVGSELAKSEIQSALMRVAAWYYELPAAYRCITVIIVDATPVADLPPTILPILRIIEIPFPTKHIIEQMVCGIPLTASEPNPDALRSDFVCALRGLDEYQIVETVNSILVKTGGKITRGALAMAQQSKERLVMKMGLLEVVKPDVDFSMIGGLEVLREDLLRKSLIFRHLDFAQTDFARVPLPKGVLILGMPGCGKSLISKAIASEFGVPLLRLDVSRLMGKFVGMSEENLRRALAAAEAASPCVLWIDELEKSFAGGQGGRADDSLVVRLMGSFLTWMQERKSAVYIVATANDVLRSEFMRKGRFDEVYFVNFPNAEERAQILRKKIANFASIINGNKTMYRFHDVDAIAQTCSELMAVGPDGGGFSGAEIESVVNTVVENKFREYLELYQTRTDMCVDVYLEDFKSVIDTMRISVLANQAANKQGTSTVARIRNLQTEHKFKNASKLPMK